MSDARDARQRKPVVHGWKYANSAAAAGIALMCAMQEGLAVLLALKPGASLALSLATAAV